MINWNDFAKVDIRTGTIITAEAFSEAKNPSYKLLIDFGELGLKKSSAQITDNYNPDSLIGKQIIAVVNFPSKQIANIMSECLVLGAIGDQNVVTLVSTDMQIKNGLRIG